MDTRVIEMIKNLEQIAAGEDVHIITSSGETEPANKKENRKKTKWLSILEEVIEKKQEDKVLVPMHLRLSRIQKDISILQKELAMNKASEQSLQA